MPFSQMKRRKVVIKLVIIRTDELILASLLLHAIGIIAALKYNIIIVANNTFNRIIKLIN